MKLLNVSLLATALLFSGSAFADEALAKKKNCLACHTVDKRSLGPTYKDIAQRYARDKDAEARIAAAILKGTPPPAGVGWKKEGKSMQAFMPPNPTVKPEEADKLAKWIMGLK